MAERDTVVWVGFELLYRSRLLGISQRRAEWLFIRWTKETADLGYVYLTSFEEVGNIIYVASVLEYERPFSGLLYTFPTIHTRISTRLLLAYVSFMLRFCIPSSSRRVVHELFSLSTACDAQASDDRAGLSLTSSVCLLSESLCGFCWNSRRTAGRGSSQRVESLCGHLDFGSAGGFLGLQTPERRSTADQGSDRPDMVG